MYVASVTLLAALQNSAGFTVSTPFLAEAYPFAQYSRTVESFGALREASSKKGPLSETVAAGCSLTSTE
jgi:hypothetical protein